MKKIILILCFFLFPIVSYADDSDSYETQVENYYKQVDVIHELQIEHLRISMTILDIDIDRKYNLNNRREAAEYKKVMVLVILWFLNNDIFNTNE